jgi:hypothetical protein
LLPLLRMLRGIGLLLLLRKSLWQFLLRRLLHIVLCVSLGSGRTHHCGLPPLPGVRLAGIKRLL